MSDLLGTIATTLSTVVCLGGTTFLFKLVGTFGPRGKPVAGGDAPSARPIATAASLFATEASSPTTSSGPEGGCESPVLTKVAATLR